MRGHTLIELLFVLLLAGVTVSSMAPGARRQRDRAAVVGAREVVVGLLAEARLAAIESGGASVRVTVSPPGAEALVGGVAVRSAALGEDFGVTVALSGGGTQAELAFDGLGLGRVASQTLTLRRGREVAELVVSAYGRVRRR